MDVDLKNLTIIIRNGKGGKGAIVYISNDCARILKQYLDIRPPLQLNGREPLFYTDYGNRWKRTEIHRMFFRYKKRARIEKVGGVHVFARHTTATILIANGCDLRHVKELLRHKDVRTTLRYTHIIDRTLRERYNQYLIL
jgi:integrase/recombinase XerD